MKPQTYCEACGEVTKACKCPPVPSKNVSEYERQEAESFKRGLIEDVEYALLECRTCNEKIRLLLTRPRDLDDSIEELGHTGHDIHIGEE